MANKAHVDDAILERRLRPIYEWLDNGNNKKAVQEADKVLRKQPNLHCALVLKGLALLRLGKQQECLSLINTVVSEGTADDATLSALTICYRELQQPEQICKLYENAVKLEPSNEELLSHLFMSHVRIGDYRRQQQTAMQLFKLKPKNPYYFWAIMSIVMQAQVTGDNATKKVSLALAERMVAKFNSEDKIDTEAEVLTYLYILEIQEKYDEALKIIESSLVNKLHQPHNFLPLKKALYYRNLKDYEAANQIYKTLILQESDNWQHYVNFVDTILEMEYDASYSTPNGKKGPLEEGAEFLNRVKESALCDNLRIVDNDSAGINSKNRSPFLGILQLALKLDERGKSQELTDFCGSPSDHLYTYICYYGDKMCCYSDIINLIPLIGKEDAKSFLDKIKSLVSFGDEGMPADVNNIYKHQIWLQMMHTLGEYDNYTPEDHLKLADSLVGCYHKWSHLSADMAPTDIRPNDTYLILASHSYLSAIKYYLSRRSREHSDNTLNQQICQLVLKLSAILEHGIAMSRANFQLKLLLIKVYNMIGATGAGYYNISEQLDLKHIQMDTLGYLLVFQSLDSGQYPLANGIFSNTLKFFMANYKDTADSLILFYKFGSLIRIPEFVEFRERLNNSLLFAMTTAEQMLLDLSTSPISGNELDCVIKQLQIDPTKDTPNWANLRDNRDLSVMNCWRSPQERKLLSTIKESTFKDDVSFLKIRTAMLKVIAAASQLYVFPHSTNNVNQHSKACVLNGEHKDDINLLSELISQLENECSILENYKNLSFPQIPIEGPDIPRIYLYARGNYSNIFLIHIKLFQNIYHTVQKPESWNEQLSNSAISLSEEIVTNHLQHVETLQLTASDAIPEVNRDSIASLSHLVQTMCLVIVILGCGHFVLLPIKSNASKKNRKKKGGSASTHLPEVVGHFNKYVSSLHSKLQIIETALQEKSKIASARRVANRRDASQNNQQPVSCPIPDLDSKNVSTCIEDSYADTLTALTDTLSARLKYLSSLKL